MRRIIPLVSLGAFLIFAPNATIAAPVQQSVAVSYADLDLARPADAAELDRRIGVAVRSLCGTASAADPTGNKRVRACRAEARAGIADQRADLLARARSAPVLAAIR